MYWCTSNLRPIVFNGQINCKSARTIKSTRITAHERTERYNSKLWRILCIICSNWCPLSRERDPNLIDSNKVWYVDVLQFRNKQQKIIHLLVRNLEMSVLESTISRLTYLNIPYSVVRPTLSVIIVIVYCLAVWILCRFMHGGIIKWLKLFCKAGYILSRRRDALACALWHRSGRMQRPFAGIQWN